MKNKFLFLMAILSFSLIIFTVPVYADSIIVDIDTSDILTNINSTYWSGSDVNFIGTNKKTNPGNSQLQNADPETEEAWLEALLGFVYNDPDISYLGETPFTDPTPKQYTGSYTGWDYAVVKYDGYWVAYEDTLNDDVLITDNFTWGVSHIRWFGSPTTPVPEPATMLLFGTGLVGLAGLGRKKFIKK